MKMRHPTSRTGHNEPSVDRPANQQAVASIKSCGGRFVWSQAQQRNAFLYPAEHDFWEKKKIFFQKKKKSCFVGVWSAITRLSSFIACRSVDDEKLPHFHPSATPVGGSIRRRLLYIRPTRSMPPCFFISFNDKIGGKKWILITWTTRRGVGKKCKSFRIRMERQIRGQANNLFVGNFILEGRSSGSFTLMLYAPRCAADLSPALPDLRPNNTHPTRRI